MRRILLLAIAALPLVAPVATAQPLLKAGVYELDSARSSLHWKVSNPGLSNYTARFTKLEATLEIDPAKLEDAKLAVIVDPTSLRTDFPFAESFDKELIENVAFFNSETFPKIKFASTKIEQTSETTFKVTGDLTLVGVTKPLTIYVTLAAPKEQPGNSKSALAFSATSTLNRSGFGIVTRIFVSDEVLLMIEGVLISSSTRR
jgi:polyisoprenoid-binding protein YceI